MGVYYVTALVALLGPVPSVTGVARISRSRRLITSQPLAGTWIDVEVPTHVAAVLEHVAGPVSTLVTSFDVPATRYRFIEVYGTEGTLSVPDPNTFGGPVQLRRPGDADWTDIPLSHGNAEQSRGLGLADMVRAQRLGRPHRASGDLALHVLEVMERVLVAAESSHHQDITTRVERPAPLAPGSRTTRPATDRRAGSASSRDRYSIGTFDRAFGRRPRGGDPSLLLRHAALRGPRVLPHLFAYLDLASGSMIVQAAIAGVVAVPILLRSHIRRFLGRDATTRMRRSSTPSRPAPSPGPTSGSTGPRPAALTGSAQAAGSTAHHPPRSSPGLAGSARATARVRLWPFPVYPLLVAIYPALLAFSGNLAEVQLSETFQPILGALAAAVATVAVAALLTRDLRRGALIASVLVALWFGWRYILLVFEPVGTSPAISLAVIASLGLTAVASAFLLPDRVIVRITSALNLVAILMVSLAVLAVHRTRCGPGRRRSLRGASGTRARIARRLVPGLRPVRQRARRMQHAAGVDNDLPEWLECRASSWPVTCRQLRPDLPVPRRHPQHDATSMSVAADARPRFRRRARPPRCSRTPTWVASSRSSATGTSTSAAGSAHEVQPASRTRTRSWHRALGLRGQLLATRRLSPLLDRVVGSTRRPPPTCSIGRRPCSTGPSSSE